MNRRSFIAQTGALSLLFLPGCTSNPGDGSNGNGSNESVRLVDSSFAVRQIEGGAQTDDATITFDAASNTIRVNGTIWGADGCTTASLDVVEFTDGDDRVSTAVVTHHREGTEDRACTQAIVEIEYEIVLTFEGGLPTTVTVTHDGRSVTTASR